MRFVVEDGAADEGDTAGAPVQLFLLQSGSKSLDTRIAVAAEEAGIVCNGVPIQKHEHRRLSQFSEE